MLHSALHQLQSTFMNLLNMESMSETIHEVDAGNMLLSAGLLSMLFHLALTLTTVGIIIHFFYYRYSRRRDYYFSFVIISLSIFFLVILLGSIKLKIGFALGIFAIFGIIRYRTEAMPIREMTYLFAITAISVINALIEEYPFLLLADAIFILSFWILESNRLLRHVSCKLIKYDNIALIHTDRHKELIEDIEQRTGLKVLRVEIGSIDFIKDATIIKVYYEQQDAEINSVDNISKLPKPETL